MDLHDPITTERRANRAAVLSIIGLALYVVAATTALAYGLHTGVISRQWVAAHAALVICGLIGIPAVPVLALVIHYDRRIKAATRTAGGRLTEVRERRSRLAVKLFSFVVPAEAIITTAMDIEHGGHYLRASDFWVPANLVMFTLFAVFVLLRAQTTDEWSESLRSRAARNGFVATLTGFCAVYLLSLVDAGWARLAAPVMIAAAVEFALIQFLIADRLASRDG